MGFDLNVLKINPKEEIEKVSDFVANQVSKTFRRSGVLIGLSGGVDSAVMASIAVHAMGKDRVAALILPERESNPISRDYALKQAKELGIAFREIDITSTVDSVGGYKERDEFIKGLIPEYTAECKYNLTLPVDLLERDSFNFYILRVRLPDCSITTKRLDVKSFRTLTAFASIKIRARMIHLYWEAERHGFIVAGTTNKTEHILGDFCKYGDGGTDIEALAHLYKNQIYQIADYINIIPEIKNRTPSPDTFSLLVSDQEFYFRIPFEKLDFLLYAWENKISKKETAEALEISVDAVSRAFRDFKAKNNATAHLRHLPYEIGL